MTVRPLARDDIRRAASRWIDRLVPPIAIVALGIVLGLQYAAPDKRVLALLAAAVMTGVAWRLDVVSGLGALVLALPFPRATVFGNTNLALILLLTVIWLLRAVQNREARPMRTPIDVPIAGWLITFIVSFYNVEPDNLRFALTNMQIMVACLVFYYLLTTNLREERDLQRIHLFQVFSLVTMCLLAFYELNHPGEALIPGWIEFGKTGGEDFDRRNVRVGGPFFDYELLAEFCAMSLLLVIFLFVRARSTTRRVVLGMIILMDVFVMFTTLTRGAIFSLAAATLYLLWIIRRQIRVVPFTIISTSVLALFFGFNFIVANYTVSGDMIARLTETTFYGMVPDSRRTAWADGWERFFEQPFIGHGPYYSSQSGTRTWFWPHNGYLLIANYVGLIGLAFYAWMTFRLLWISRPDVDHLDHPSYARSFLIVAHLQLLLFMVDQMKIDFLRNNIYQFQVWLLFASIVAAHRIASAEKEAEGQPPPLPRAAA